MIDHAIYHTVYTSRHHEYSTAEIVIMIIVWLVVIFLEPTVHFIQFITAKQTSMMAIGRKALPPPHKDEPKGFSYAEDCKKLSEQGGYIKNNTAQIEIWLHVFTPSFSAENFMEFAKCTFSLFVMRKDASQMNGLVSADVDTSILPADIELYEASYLHNYILQNGKENIKVFFTVLTGKDEFEQQVYKRYFVTFTRNNPFVNITNDTALSVYCPCCGAEIRMGEELNRECEYCGCTITFSEGDWVVSDIELITEETIVCNWDLIRSI